MITAEAVSNILEVLGGLRAGEAGRRRSAVITAEQVVSQLALHLTPSPEIVKDSFRLVQATLFPGDAGRGDKVLAVLFTALQDEVRCLIFNCDPAMRVLVKIAGGEARELVHLGLAGEAPGLSAVLYSRLLGEEEFYAATAVRQKALPPAVLRWIRREFNEKGPPNVVR